MSQKPAQVVRVQCPKCQERSWRFAVRLLYGVDGPWGRIILRLQTCACKVSKAATEQLEDRAVDVLVRRAV